MKFNIDPESLLFIPGKVWVYWKDSEGYFLGCNDLMAEELNLCTRKDIIDRNDYDIFQNEDHINHYRKCDNTVMATGSAQQFQDISELEKFIIKFNSIKWPLTNTKGNIIGIVGISYQMEHSKTINLASLTPRENEVLRYAVKGKTARAIAQILEISPRTVEQHLEKIKLKTKMATKADLISYFAE